MKVIEGLLKDVALPRMAPVRQLFDGTEEKDVAGAVLAEIAKPGIAERIRPGMTVAVGVGSRGLAELPTLVRATVEGLRARGAEPFIVPAMGSHGGATDEGQAALLAKLGVTAESVGCPIRSSMGTVELGRLPNGLPILMDRLAMQADGIVVINRVKPHTSFSGEIESGLAKMITIGLGKQQGAESCHAQGFGMMAENVVEMARIKLGIAPILFGIATVENAYDRIRHTEAVPAEEILAREPELLRMAKANMPRVLFNPLDVLVVDLIGKEFSGTGADPNITGRPGTPYLKTELEVGRLVYLALSPKSGGNATGMGLCDVTTRALFDGVDFAATYANHLTSTVLTGAKVPMMMDSDRRAVQAAIKTCNAPDMGRLRVVQIP
ncbi:MAG: nickel-dependent lactate racemase, partial [Alphaproteobacteria bacterium]|nr:nickel-dependent lactate racemase [Alphaproteobacteria bacterium]